jgi:hypothetical protein
MAAEPPPRIKAVQQYLLEQDYPELFGDTPYRIKADDVVEVDLDGDGVDEVVMLMRPHFRQSPTIVIFQVSKNLRVRRVKEGLAPGPLQPLSGDFLDGHTLGMGVDVTIADAPTDPKQRRELVAISMKEMGGVVEYANFLHMDGRKGKGMYIDMTGLPRPPKDPNCEKFEFSRVDEIAVAKKDDGSGNYLLAMVGKELYVYKIHKIRADGLLDKTLTIKPAP